VVARGAARGTASVTARATALVALVAGCGSSAQRPCSQAAGLSVCAGPSTLPGIDVSTYQSTVDWAKVAGAGIVFAIARVSDGTTVLDDQFDANWSGMKANGVTRGVYQFFRASEDPIAQAELVLQKLAQQGPSDLPVVMDIETADGQSAATVQMKMQQWLNHLHAAGQRTMVYTAAFMSQTIGTGFAAEPLWVANYGTTCPTMPAGWSSWIIWQHSDKGSVAGIGGAVDLDEFDGDAAALGGFVAGAAGDGGVDLGPAPTPDGGC
jgi:lysozyme